VKLWLDDMRPAPVGWQWAKTVQEAQELLSTGDVDEASLDHDLGACEKCLGGKTPEQWLEETNFTAMPHCDHFGTGYNLVCWMEEHNIWPKQKPTVHSRYPAGRTKMQQAINRRFS
jgi:hypothetical protein